MPLSCAALIKKDHEEKTLHIVIKKKTKPDPSPVSPHAGMEKDGCKLKKIIPFLCIYRIQEFQIIARVSWKQVKATNMI